MNSKRSSHIDNGMVSNFTKKFSITSGNSTVKSPRRYHNHGNKRTSEDLNEVITAREKFKVKVKN